MKQWKRVSGIVLSGMLVLSMTISGMADTASEAKAKKATLKTKNVKLSVGESKKIKLISTKKSCRYTFKSNKKKVAAVSKKGKITAIKAGSAKITVKEIAKKKKGKARKVGIVKVKVTESQDNTKDNNATATPDNSPTNTPDNSVTSTDTPGNTSSPSPSPTPTASPTPKPTPTVPAEYRPPSDYTTKKADVAYGERKEITYYSTTTERDRKAYVVLPPGYDESKKYPVVYLLHGIGGDHTEWFSGGKPIEILGNLIAAGEADEMIMVFPNIRARANDGAAYELTPDAFQAFDNFINDLRDNLMPYIEKNYPVKTGRENTAICGLSMGGRESLYIGLTMADKIGYIGAFEPAIGVLPYNIEDGLFTEDTMTLPDEYKNNTFLMIVKGQSDSVVGEWPLTYHKTLEKNGVPHLYYDMPGGHDFSVWNNGLYNFAKRIFSKSGTLKKSLLPPN
ncbi:MAG: esterase family protein [Lachnospiraceae bacterium]|nr:esterase family protein [Lachnospiraceae bacterium]